MFLKILKYLKKKGFLKDILNEKKRKNILLKNQRKKKKKPL